MQGMDEVWGKSVINRKWIICACWGKNSDGIYYEKGNCIYLVRKNSYKNRNEKSCGILEYTLEVWQETVKIIDI